MTLDIPTIQDYAPPALLEGLDDPLITLPDYLQGSGGQYLRELYKSGAHPGFLVDFADFSTFPDTADLLRFDGSEPRRIQRAHFSAGRYTLILFEGGGTAMLVEAVADREDTARVLPVVLTLDPEAIHQEAGAAPFLIKGAVSKDGTSGLIAENAESREVLTDLGISAAAMPTETALRRTLADRLALEITAWGAALSARFDEHIQHPERLPAEVCRHVLRKTEDVADMKALLTSLAAQAIEQFSLPEEIELRLHVYGPTRPSQRGLPSSPRLHLELRQVSDGHSPDPHGPWKAVETEMIASWSERFDDHVRRRWPDGWFVPIGPETTSRLGIGSQLRKCAVRMTGPLTAHQRIAAQRALR